MAPVTQPENTGLLEQARQWSQQAQSVMRSTQQGDHRNLLMVLGLGSVIGLLLGLHSLWLMLQGVSQVRTPWVLLIGGAACVALWIHARRRGSAPQWLRLLVCAALCASNLVAVGLNGAAGLTFVGGYLVMLHLLLEPRGALVLCTAYLAGLVLAVALSLTPVDPALSVRSIGSGVAILVAMQLLARHWRTLGQRFERLSADIGEVVRGSEAQIEQVRRETLALERTDPMTGLPNAAGFRHAGQAWLQQQQQQHHGLLACVRLAQWRNSLAALAFSEQQALTERLVGTITDTLGPKILLGRIGPDSLAILIDSEQPDGEDARQRLGALHEALLRPVVAGTLTALTEPQIGFSRAPADGDTVDELMHKAQRACAAADGAADAATLGPQRFDMLLERRLSEQEAAVQALTSALELGQFELELLPVVESGTLQCHAAEARVMWNHPERGRVSASTLLPQALLPQLTQRITLWKLEAAAQRVEQVRKDSGLPFQLSVNLPSAWLQKTVREPGPFLEHLLALRSAPQALVLEIPEDALLGDIADLSQWMTMVKSLGFGLAVDHFGAGYSCFSQLDRLPVDALKMDRTFVAPVGQSTRETAVCGAIVRVAHELGLKVVAEGVLSAEQARRLRDIGCDQLQGPGVSPALRPEDLLAWMKTASASALR